MSSTKRIFAGLAILVFFIAAGFVQSRREEAAYQKLWPTFTKAERVSHRLKKAAARLDEFQRDKAELEAELDRLEALIPLEPGVEAFVAELEAAGVTIADLREIEARDLELHLETELELVYATLPVAPIEESVARIVATQAAVDESQRVVLYSAAVEGGPTAPSGCPEVVAPTMLFPFGSGLAHLVADLDELCKHRETETELLGEIEAFMFHQAELENRRALVNQIARSLGRMDLIIETEPAERPDW